MMEILETDLMIDIGAKNTLWCINSVDLNMPRILEYIKEEENIKKYFQGHRASQQL